MQALLRRVESANAAGWDVQYGTRASRSLPSVRAQLVIGARDGLAKNGGPFWVRPHFLREARSRSALGAERDVTPPRRRREEETATGAFEVFLVALLRCNKFKALLVQIQSAFHKNTIAFFAKIRDGWFA